MAYENEAVGREERIRGAMADAKAKTTAPWFANENDRRIKDAHDALTTLFEKLQPLLPRAEPTTGAGGQAVSMAASSQLSEQLRDQNEALASLVNRINRLHMDLDL